MAQAKVGKRRTNPDKDKDVTHNAHDDVVRVLLIVLRQCDLPASKRDTNSARQQCAKKEFGRRCRAQVESHRPTPTQPQTRQRRSRRVNV